MSWLKRFQTRKSPLASPSGEPKNLELREGTAEYDEFVARAEIEKGENLAHGASHLANLLNFDPGNQDWIALFGEYFDRTGGELETLIPRGEKLYSATEAMRALIWYRQGRLGDAAELMIEVTRATHPNYLHAWVLGWVEPKGAIESLKEPIAHYLLGLVLTNMPEARLATQAQMQVARRWASVSERVLAQNEEDSRVRMIRAGILRKAGRFDEALRAVKAPIGARPDWNRAVAVGLILRQKGDLEQASEAFEAAQRVDPGNMSTYLEGGDTFYEAQRWQEARGWYQRALAKEPGQEWAKPSDLFCEWKLTGGQQVLDRLFEMANAGNGRAHGLLSEAYDTPYEPEDASANILRELLEKSAETGLAGAEGSVDIGASSLEAPSNRLAFALTLAAQGADISVNFQVGAIPEPDPRQPSDAVRYRLWDYQGTTAKPALPAPSERVSQAIAELASGPFHRERSFARASYVAAELGPAALPDILAVMVHPPKLPEGRDALEFIPRIQLEAMHVAGQVDEGWQDSERRSALMSVLFGPMDWTTNAAIDVLAYLAQRHPALAYDVHKSFQYLEKNRPSSGYCCWLRRLYSRWQSLPLLYNNEREELRAKLKAAAEQPEQ
jgi:tetratricopeptide (TPR) repeat protein